MSRIPRLGLALLLLVSLLLTALPLPVLAQGGTVLAVDPAQASVEVNGQREIALLVTDADNLNAFDVQVEYNGDLLSLVKWEFGDLLSNLAVVKRDDLPGSFRLVATQLATPGVSGDGVLLKLTFSGKLTGSSAIMITKAEFARSEGGLSLPELQNGSISIIPAQPTATLTHTPTVTATLTPTATATIQPSATVTATKTATKTVTLAPTATKAASATPAPTRTAGIGQTAAAPTATQSAVVAAGATDQPASTATQAEPGKPTDEGGAIVAQTAEDSAGSGNSGGGNGYFLQRSRNSPSPFFVMLFILGLLAIGAAVVIYYRRKKPGLK
ncbi:MAG: cohesin domain-containing protein [Anaerolineaceae bacterium]